jgi:hypothetical protein
LAGASLMFRYQWLAFWRRALRTGRVKFYLTSLMLLVWITVIALPDTLCRAAGELAAGHTASMDTLLLVLCLLWLAALGEDLNVSLSSDRLRRFPLDVVRCSRSDCYRSSCRRSRGWPRSCRCLA